VTDPTIAALNNELTAIDTQLSRVDAKAGLLLGISGAAITVTLSVLPSLSRLAILPGVLTVCAFVGCAVLFILAVRPTLNLRSSRYGFVTNATATSPAAVTQAVTEATTADARAVRLIAISGLVLRKYRRIRIGINFMFIGLALAVITVVINWATTH